MSPHPEVRFEPSSLVPALLYATHLTAPWSNSLEQCPWKCIYLFSKLFSKGFKDTRHKNSENMILRTQGPEKLEEGQVQQKQTHVPYRDGHELS